MAKVRSVVTGIQKTAELLKGSGNRGNQMLVTLGSGDNGSKAHSRADCRNQGDIRHSLDKCLKGFHRVPADNTHGKTRQKQNHSGFIPFNKSYHRKNNGRTSEPNLPGHSDSPISLMNPPRGLVRQGFFLEQSDYPEKIDFRKDNFINFKLA